MTVDDLAALRVWLNSRGERYPGWFPNFFGVWRWYGSRWPEYIEWRDQASRAESKRSIDAQDCGPAA